MVDLDPELGPFGTLYHEWIDAYPGPRDPEIEQRLAAMYRQAWASGDEHEQYYVLCFIWERRDAADADLMVEALRSPFESVASHAGPCATGWVTRDGLLELTPEVIDAFRTMAIQHPHTDIGRWPMMRRDDGWPEGRPFVQLFEKWHCDDVPRDDALEAQLAATHREAWKEGDAVDRAFVLSFIGRNYSGSLDLIVEGLKSDDRRLADEASFQVWCGIGEGVDFGPDIREILEDHRDRFPCIGGTAWSALRELDKSIHVPSVPRSYQTQLPREE